MSKQEKLEEQKRKTEEAIQHLREEFAGRETPEPKKSGKEKRRERKAKRERRGENINDGTHLAGHGG